MSDITANVVIGMPSQLFTMPRSFKAVANGKIYIGQIDTDPLNPANQIQVYLENEDGSHVPVSQPLIINAGGYPVYNGQIAKFVTVQGHSMAVYDAYGAQQFYYPNVLKYDPDQLRQDLAAPGGLNLVDDAQSRSALQASDGSKNIGSGERTLLDHINDIRHSKDFSTLKDAIDSSLPKNDLLVSPGIYSENVTLGNAQLKGVGGATVIKAQGDFSTAVTAKLSTPHWQFRHSSNFEIDGTGTTGASGFSYDPAEQYSGRHNLSDAYIHHINKAIQKPSGNIGNTFRNIGINSCEWGYYARSDTEMHCGADTLYNFHMDSIGTYAVYLNATIGASSTGGGVGGWWLKDSIIESSPGGGVYLKNKPGDCPTAPCGISNIWFESIATAGAVNVDGVAVLPRTLHLIDTSIFFAEYSYINSIKLERSNLVTYGCRFDDADGNQNIEIDAESTIKAYETYLNGTPGPNVIVESIASQIGKFSTINLSLRGSLTKGRLYNPPSGNKLSSITFDSGTHTWTGNASITGTASPRGLHSSNCEAFSFPIGSVVELVDSRVNISNGLWYVWGINARLDSGDAVMKMTGGITLGEVYLKQGEWISTFGIAQAASTEVSGLNVTASSASVIYLADYFVASFASQSEALAFANTRMALA
ncbi:TPA: phage head-binding domain-containing protein [Citrobacter freundii]